MGILFNGSNYDEMQAQCDRASAKLRTEQRTTTIRPGNVPRRRVRTGPVLVWVNTGIVRRRYYPNDGGPDAA